MDDKTLAAFRASGEKDIATFLAKQGAQNDLPPGVSGYSGGTQNFAGTTSAEGQRAQTPGTSFQDKVSGALSAGFARLSGIPAALQTAGESLGIVSPQPATGSQGNVLTASGRLGQPDPAIDALQARSTQLGQVPSEIAAAAEVKAKSDAGAVKLLNSVVTGQPLLTADEEAKKKQTDKILNSRTIGQNVLASASKLRSLGPDNILDTLNPR